MYAGSLLFGFGYGFSGAFSQAKQVAAFAAGITSPDGGAAFRQRRAIQAQDRVADELHL